MTRRRASLYLRISVNRDESDSIERQERDLRRLAADEGLDVVAVHVDDGISGAATERPAFRAWLADAEEGRADVLLAWRFDRISREGLGAVARILDVLKLSGARLLTHGDRMDSDSAAFRLTAAVLSEVAYAERESIRARVTSRQAADRRRGYWTKARPFGYSAVDGRLVQLPAEATIVRDLVARLLGGASLRALAAHLHDEGVPTARALKGHRVTAGARWGISSVRAILTSPTLAGHYPRRSPGGQIVAARDDHGDLVTVSDDPILSPGEFAAVQRALTDRTVAQGGVRRPRGGRPPAHPLSGLLRCECGAALVHDRGKFRCARHTANPSACPGQFVPAAAVEEALAYRILRYVPALDPASPEADAIRLRFLRATDPADDARRGELTAALDDVRAALEDLEAARYERGEFRDSAGLARFERLHERLQARAQVAEEALAALPPPARNDAALFDREILRETLESDDAGSRRALYLVALEAVVVALGKGSDALDDRITPRWASRSLTH